MRRTALLTSTVLVALGIAVPALAATTTGIGAFTPLTGSSTDYESTMQLPATGFPEASVTSSSRSGQVGPQTGATNWFGASTPVGLEYGSSQGQPYLNLRPKVDSATGASLTTYTFERGTPTGWAFVLGDIDADAVTISATRDDGTAATAAELGFQGVFNLCDTSPRPSACSGVVAPFDTPTPSSTATTTTLTGNVGATDTVGAAGWFEPAVSLRTLSFSFVRRSGFPVYQTWFAIKKQDVSGTVSGCADVSGIGVRLIDAAGAAVATTETAADGSYGFLGVAASDGYDVEISGLPDGCIADGPTRQSIDLSAGTDDEANFDVRATVPVPISGTVKDDDGNPLAGVLVEIDDGTNPVRTVTTDSDGYYVFDTNPAATYTLSATPPSGYSVDSSPSPVVIAPSDTEPVVDRNFVLDADPSVSGSVTDSQGGVGGLTVVLLDGGVEVDRTTTGSDGGYSFALVPSGSYTVAVPDPPGDYIEPTPEGANVASDDVTGVDLFLARPGSITGTVTKDGEPVADAVVTITGPSSFSEELTTDDEGNYAIGDLSPGGYTATLTPPEGTTIDNPSAEVVIPPGGGDFGAVDFAIEDIAIEDPDTPEDPDAPDSADGSGVDDSDQLPDTGGPFSLVGPLGVVLLAAGSVLVHATRFRGRHRG